MSVPHLITTCFYQRSFRVRFNTRCPVSSFFSPCNLQGRQKHQKYQWRPSTHNLTPGCKMPYLGEICSPLVMLTDPKYELKVFQKLLKILAKPALEFMHHRGICAIWIPKIASTPASGVDLSFRVSLTSFQAGVEHTEKVQRTCSKRLVTHKNLKQNAQWSTQRTCSKRSSVKSAGKRWGEKRKERS